MDFLCVVSLNKYFTQMADENDLANKLNIPAKLTIPEAFQDI